MPLPMFRSRRRRRLMAEPLAPELREHLEPLPFYRRLTDDHRARLDGLVNVFLREKRFEGCNGFEITDQVRAVVAAQACLLLLGHDKPSFYRTLRTILVYPDRYVVPSAQRMPDGSIASGGQVRLGESWLRGAVVLSWADALRGALAHDDGHNLVFHEFAHQLDGEDNNMNGAPILRKDECYGPWARTLSSEFDNLRRDLAAGRLTEINPYGSTNPAEFFAVLTESFFERPATLREKHPELYESLRCYYNQDPASRPLAPAQADP